MRLEISPLRIRPKLKHAEDRHAKCKADIEKYCALVVHQEFRKANMLRRLISLYVAPGVYIRGDDEAERLYAVFNVECPREQGKPPVPGSFRVQYVSISRSGAFEGEFVEEPLVGKNGFLYPIKKPPGARFIHIGQLFHP